MTLEEQLDHDLKEAMRGRQEDRVRAIRMLKAAIASLRFARTDPKHPQHGQSLAEGDLLRVVENQLKQRRESIELYQRGSRPELAAKEQAEIAALEPYLPRQLSRDEIAAQVDQVIAGLGTRDFPRVMREAASRLRGRADGKLINEVVRSKTGPPG